MKTVFLLFLFSSCYSINAQNLQHSIVRNDNGWVAYHDKESSTEINPATIVAKFKDIISANKYEGKSAECYSYKVNLNDTVCFYSLIVKSLLGCQCYLFAYNKFTNATSKNPAVLNLKWAYNNEDGFSSKLLDYPLMSVKNENGIYTVFLKERVHNGTQYNAVITKLYNLNCNDMALQLKFCYESITRLDEAVKIKRFLSDDKIDVFVEKNNRSDYIGMLQIDEQNLKIVGKDCEKDEYCSFLFTSSGKEDEDILRNGFTLSY